jgi:hypothetical protein
LYASRSQIIKKGEEKWLNKSNQNTDIIVLILTLGLRMPVLFVMMGKHYVNILRVLKTYMNNHLLLKPYFVVTEIRRSKNHANGRRTLP